MKTPHFEKKRSINQLSMLLLNKSLNDMNTHKNEEKVKILSLNTKCGWHQ